MGIQRLTLISALLFLVSCEEKNGIVIGAADVGEACRQISDCRPGLYCDNDKCAAIEQPSTAGRAGSPCTDDTQCAAGLCCGNQDVCRSTVAGGGCGLGSGNACGLTADCDLGLVCDGSGTCAAPGSTAGQGEIGDACGELTDCLRPLICGANDTCEAPPFFPGVSCTRSEEDLGAFRVYFEVPTEGPLDEFYRQPFPSNVRFRSEHIDVSGHPAPGSVGGIDFEAVYLTAIEEDLDGFGLTQPTFLRFSDGVDETTLRSEGTDVTVKLVDIDVGSPERGREIPIQLRYQREKAQFICGNALAVAPVDGLVLRPKTTYAVIVTSKVRSFRGEAPIHDGDFAAMVGPEPPASSALREAYDAYAPFRAFLQERGMPANDIAVAAVYTTGDPAASGAPIREAVRASSAPTLSEVTRCDTGVISPCAEGSTRGCSAAATTHHELHAKVTSPVLQRGTRPYLTPGPGGFEGAFAKDAAGGIVVQGTEDICVALAIPKGRAMPANGWPTVIYAHGTGGDFSSGMGQVAEDLANAGIATLTFDGAMHGPRQGLPPAARLDEGRLFFNAANPRAARDNVLQGAADVYNLVRLLESLELTQSSQGIDARFNAAKIMYYGHSQGTVVGAPFLAFEPGLRAAVFTGAGAEIGLTLISKKRPNDVASLTRAIFGDQTVSRLHPMIALMSLFFGASDATPYAAMIAAAPPVSKPPLDFLHIYGLGDGYTPEVTQAALVRAGGYPVAGTVLRALDGVGTVPMAIGNLNGASVAALQYEPSSTNQVPDYDGHFVGTRHPEAKAAVLRFLSSAATSTAPATIQR